MMMNCFSIADLLSRWVLNGCRINLGLFIEQHNGALHTGPRVRVDGAPLRVPVPGIVTPSVEVKSPGLVGAKTLAPVQDLWREVYINRIPRWVKQIGIVSILLM